MDPIKWGIIGCGNVTEVKSGPAFNKVPNSQLIAVMRRDATKAKDYAERHGVPKWYSDATDLIADPDVKAIYIATPPDTHEEYAVKAMRAGKPVYVEKPMARNADECARMNAVSKETGVPLFVAYYRRALPYFQKVKNLVDSRVIGDMKFIQINLQWQSYPEEIGNELALGWRVNPEISGGGHFHDLASHQFDLLEYIFGKVQTANGLARNQAGLYKADDIVVAQWEFENGMLGSGTWCFTINETDRIDEAKIVGSLGSITFSFFEKFDIIVKTVAGTEVYHIPYPEHVQQPLIEEIVKHLRGLGNSPSTGESGIRASIILDSITKR